MPNTLHHEAAWYRAMKLSERAASLCQPGATGERLSCARERARRRVAIWRSQEPFPEDSIFEERVAFSGITEEQLLLLLGESAEEIRGRVITPAWLSEIAGSLHSKRSLAEAQGPHDDSVRGKLLSLLKPFAPMIAQAQARLCEGIDAMVATADSRPFDRSTIEGILFTNLPWRLLNAVSRTMVLELNVARVTDQLEGETPKDRYAFFIAMMSDEARALDLLHEYPVLARQLLVMLNQWVDFSLEFLNHLCSDWRELCTTFSHGQDPGVVVKVDGGLGDSHRDGRSVRTVEFSSGLRLVYKPKAMAVDRHFQELLDWINQRDSGPGGQWFRTIKVADRGTYGWVEFVQAEDCNSLEGVRYFYQRLGGYLALLYALEAVDFHYENLLAAGEHPVLVDLEALFQPRPKGNDDDDAAAVAARKVEHSVMRVGLLPWRFLASADSNGWDVGGLTSPEGQLSPFEVPHWQEAGTDTMKFTRRRATMGESHNRPTIAGRPVELLDHADAIIDGFKRMYRTLGSFREELLAADGPINRFSADEVRAILRPTMAYAVLLDEGWHPDVLRDAMDRDRLFDRLWLALKRVPHLRRVLPYELEDLWRGDIPFFATRPESRDLWASRGEHIPAFFEKTALSRVHSRLSALGEENLQEQLWFVNAALATRPARARKTAADHFSLREPARLTRPGSLLSAARDVGDRLESLALFGRNDATWIGLSGVHHAAPFLSALGLDFYDGLPGIAMFLAHLGAITGEERYRTLAERTVNAMLREIEDAKGDLKSIGGFSGWGGVLYSLAHLSAVLGRHDLLAEAEQIVALLPPLIAQDRALDIIDGSAGTICGLLALHAIAPSAHTLEAAVLCGEHLLAAAQPEANGIGWLTCSASRPLTGLAHGAAGFAMALFAVADAASDPRFERAALAALEYERSQFSPELQNWLDHRDLLPSGERTQPVRTCMTAWCAGAAGIGLARLCSLGRVEQSLAIPDIEIALRTTIRHGFGSNHSLCHGDFGNLELLLEASRSLDPSIADQLNRLTSLLLEDIESQGWICGHPLAVESPGLMTGVTGIGYQLLRLAEPGRVPSILTLRPPVVATNTREAAKKHHACVA